MKTIVALFSIIVFSFSALAGNGDRADRSVKNISGKITDQQGNEIPAAQITIKETNESYFADANGNFNFQVKTDRIYSICVKSIGYSPAVISSDKLSNFSEINLFEL